MSKRLSKFFFLQVFFACEILFAQENAVHKPSGVHLFSEGEVEAKLVPRCEFSSAIKNFVWKNADPKKMGFAEEILYSVQKSSLKKNGGEVDINAVSKTLRSISKMQGMQYFSRSRKVWNVLYSRAFRVENPDEKKPQAARDAASGNANGQEIFAFLDDHTFGESVYKISYKQSEKEFLMLMQNHSALSYGPVKAVKPGDLKMCVCVIDAGAELLFYIANYAEFKMPAMLKTRLTNSFETRLEAIFNWFVKEVGK